MIKRLLYYTVFVAILFFISFTLHRYLADVLNTTYPFNLRSLYLFHAISSFSLCIIFETLSAVSRSFKEQLGFIYLGTTVLKVMLFFIVFSEVLLYGALLSKGAKITLLFPLCIFVIFEVIVVAKILNRAT